jgi:hypothetical protein
VVAFVDHHHRSQQAHHVAQRALDDRALLRARLFSALPRAAVGIEVGHRLQQRPVRVDVVLARQEAQHVAAVAEEAQRLLALPRRRLQHQQHHAQVRVHVQP